MLGPDIRDLIRKILQKDPIKRITIPQILAHHWFTSPPRSIFCRTNSSSHPVVVPQSIQAQPSATTSESSATSESSFRSASSELDASSATTPDDISHESVSEENPQIHRYPSQSTIRKAVQSEGKKQLHPETVMEEDSPLSVTQPSFIPHSPRNKEPPALPTRTPVRTKRRSVSSNLSDPSSPAEQPLPSLPPKDFASLLNTPAPIIFGTKFERELLNSLSSLGFDTGQIVHSVLSDSCDAASAIWWMLVRRAERKAVEEESDRFTHLLQGRAGEMDAEARGSVERKRPSSSSATTDPETPTTVRADQPTLLSAHSAPELALIPPTPTSTIHSRVSVAAKTPPRVPSPMNALLSPTASTTDSQPRSHPSTPSGNFKEKDRDRDREVTKIKRDGKMRSGSVSIMQRATTALEAAGLVRKKSTEAVREDKLKEKEGEKRAGTSEESRPSHGSGKLVKLPPPPSRDTPVLGTTTPDQEVVASVSTPNSPWVLTRLSNSSPPEISPTPSPGDTLTSLPQISPKEGGQHRNRASLLSAFRTWFNEDRKRKRKSSAKGTVNAPYVHGVDPRTPTTPGAGRNSVKAKRRVSSGGGASRKGHRAKGPSVSSRRSSSVNSRRSSTASMAQVAMESPQFAFEHMVTMSRQRSDPSRRSFGSRTPNSERGELIPSRPSSVHSFTVGKQRHHRKSPSTSSAGSLQLARTTSYHRRAGSGSSTRVVRSPAQATPRAVHLRSNSATSSIHSLPSSRHGSFYEQSESEAQRTGSPFRPHSRSTIDETPRRGQAHGNSTFVAQKRQTPFQPPLLTGSNSTSSRSSWKKSWGLEPPGWQTRTARLPIEVLAISPAAETSVLRDVFTGRPSLSPEDEDEWVDVDDEPGYVGGVGQTPTLGATFFSTNSGLSPIDSPFGGFPLGESTIILGTPRIPNSARAQKGKRASKVSSNRTKPGTPPIGRVSPLPDSSLDGVPEARGGRRQLPNTRPGPAFKHAIQEEDEDEGEE